MPERSENGSLIKMLENAPVLLLDKRVMAGFDGFIDTILRIKQQPGPDAQKYFPGLSDFGAYILGKKGKSFSLETEEKAVRLGGNMPILSHAMGCLGVTVDCVGALGYPAIHRVFRNMSPNCRLHSFAEPGTATAFEFDDGKMMMAQMGELHQLDWEAIKALTGLDHLKNILLASDLICLLNWSEIHASTSIWKGILKDILQPAEKDNQSRQFFFDLSDGSSREGKDILEALSLLRQFSTFGSVTLGLNRNEATILFRLLETSDLPDSLHQLGKTLYDRLGIDELLIHGSRESIAFTDKEIISQPCFFTPSPVTTTGAGDHFNAGYGIGLLAGFPVSASLLLGNAVAGYYVSTGLSPAQKDLIGFLAGSATR